MHLSVCMRWSCVAGAVVIPRITVYFDPAGRRCFRLSGHVNAAPPGSLIQADEEVVDGAASDSPVNLPPVYSQFQGNGLEAGPLPARWRIENRVTIVSRTAWKVRDLRELVDVYGTTLSDMLADTSATKS